MATKPKVCPDLQDGKREPWNTYAWREKVFLGETVALIFGKQKWSLIETARAFIDNLSKDTVVSRASKTLEAEIDSMEKAEAMQT